MAFQKAGGGVGGNEVIFHYVQVKLLRSEVFADKCEIKLALCPPKEKNRLAAVFSLVEMRGIEPLSENNLTRLSSGGVCYLHSLTMA